MRKCLNCSLPLTGRIGKKYCNTYCKSNYHYERNKEKENSLFKKIDEQLKLNRRLLRSFNKSGKSTVRVEKIKAEGFDPQYFTHYWKTKGGEIYLFCYEYGFLKRREHDKSKYILVVWQDYMK